MFLSTHARNRRILVQQLLALVVVQRAERLDVSRHVGEVQLRLTNRRGVAQPLVVLDLEAARVAESGVAAAHASYSGTV